MPNLDSRSQPQTGLKPMYDVDLIKKELVIMKDFFVKVIQIVPNFDITNPKILPYGLKPHTRSVSWIVEQVIVQQAKFNAAQLGVNDVDFELPDTSLHDCIILRNDSEKYYVNVKITSTTRRNKNDISAVEKLYMQYQTNPDYRLIYAVFRFEFDNTKIIFIKDSIHTFSPQFLPIYINPRNDKIQSEYYAPVEERTRERFLTLLKENSQSIVL